MGPDGEQRDDQGLVRYRLKVAYEGTEFAGWQKQEPPDPDAAPDAEGRRPRLHLRTVQHVLEQAIRATLREPSVTTRGASRTDAGVHAAGQVVAFNTRPDAARGVGWPRERGTEALVRALNSRLPADVLVLEAAEASLDFDPIGGAVRKSYSYAIRCGRTRPLWDRRFACWVWHDLDLALMQRAAQDVVGEHDFAAFAQASHGRKSTVRTVFACSVRETEPSHGVRGVRIDVEGSGFLYNMVRIIAGTLVEIGRGRTAADAIPGILAGRDRAAAGPTMAPEGLRLEWISYG